MESIISAVIGALISGLMTFYVMKRSERRSNEEKSSIEVARLNEQRVNYIDDMLLRLAKTEIWMSLHSYVGLKDAEAVEQEFQKVREVILEMKVLIHARFPHLIEKHQALISHTGNFKMQLVSAVSRDDETQPSIHLIEAIEKGLSAVKDFREILISERKTSQLRQGEWGAKSESP